MECIKLTFFTSPVRVSIRAITNVARVALLLYSITYTRGASKCNTLLTGIGTATIL